MRPWYCTREAVLEAVGASYTSRIAKLIDRQIGMACDAIDGKLHRRFYPEYRTFKLDYPNWQLAPTWTLWLESNEIISLQSLTSGGHSIPTNAVLPRRSDDIDEPPYDQLQIDLSTSYAFSASTTWQQAVEIEALTGYNATNTSLGVANLASTLNSSAVIAIFEPSDGIYNIGVGRLLLIDNEYIILTERSNVDTGDELQSAMAAQPNAVTVAVTDGTAFARGELLTIGSERMRIVDIVGNNLIVDRAIHGSILSTHSMSDTVYAARQFNLLRGQLGTTSAEHSTADIVYAHDVPPLIEELATALAVTGTEQSSAGYARNVGTETSQRDTDAPGLTALWVAAKTTYGRVRSGAI